MLMAMKSNAKNIYQNTVYKAASMLQIINEPIIKPGDTLNSDVSISITCVSFADFGFIKLMVTIIISIAKKAIVILSKKG